MRLSLLVVSLWLITSPLWGKIVFYSKRDGNPEIYTMRSDGNNQTRLTSNEASDLSPSWSPNGRQIAFHSFRDENWEVYVMEADGWHQRNLTQHPAFDVYPNWSPDGSQIAFSSTRNGGENQDINIFVMDADGSNVKQITDMKFASRPNWSPDAKRIAFEAFIGHSREIYVINADGTDRFRVSEPKPKLQMFLGGWSPDGKQILYQKMANLNPKHSFVIIATLNLVGRGEVKQRDRAPVPRIPLHSAVFAADGESILFSSKTNNAWNIYRFHLTDHSLIQLTDSPGADVAAHEWNSRLPVSPQRLTPKRWGEIKSNSHHSRGIGGISIPPIP